MSEVKDVHEERETLAVDVYLPGHAPRVTTPLFTRSRNELLGRPGACCFICGEVHTHAEPLEAHHYPIERSFAEMIDFGPGSELRAAFPNFDWAAFDIGHRIEHVPESVDPEDGEALPAYDRFIPRDPYLFVDDMRVNGLLLCKKHHTGKNEGIHYLPHPIWIAQKYGREGYKFSDVEVIHHVEAAPC